MPAQIMTHGRWTGALENYINPPPPLFFLLFSSPKLSLCSLPSHLSDFRLQFSLHNYSTLIALSSAPIHSSLYSPPFFIMSRSRIPVAKFPVAKVPGWRCAALSHELAIERQMAKAAPLSREEIVAQRIASRRRQVLNNLSPKVRAAAAKLGTFSFSLVHCSSFLLPLHRIFIASSLHHRRIFITFSLRICRVFITSAIVWLTILASAAVVDFALIVALACCAVCSLEIYLSSALNNYTHCRIALIVHRPVSDLSDACSLSIDTTTFLVLSSLPLSISSHLWCFSVALVLSTFRESHR